MMAGLFGNKKFDPEGTGYDYATAKSLGYGPDGKGEDAGHWASRDSMTGMMLKGASHPTFDKAVRADEAEGYRLTKRGGRYYTILGDAGLDH